MNLVFTVHVLGHKQQTFIQTKAECHVLIIQSFEIYEHTSFILSFDWNPVRLLPSFPLPNPCQRAFKCRKKKALSIRKWI